MNNVKTDSLLLRKYDIYHDEVDEMVEIKPTATQQITLTIKNSVEELSYMHQPYM